MCGHAEVSGCANCNLGTSKKVQKDPTYLEGQGGGIPIGGNETETAEDQLTPQLCRGLQIF